MKVGGLALWILIASACWALAGCGDDDSSGGDGGTDTDTDSDADAGVDAGNNYDAEILWAKRSGTDSEEYIDSFAVLLDDSLVMASWYMSETIFGEGEATETTLGGAEACPSVTTGLGALAKYAPDGSLLWAKGLGHAPGTAIAALPTDDFALAGFFCGTPVFGEGEPNEIELTDQGAAIDMYLAVFEADGSLIWAKSIVSDNDAIPWEVAAAPDGSVFIYGAFTGSIIFAAGQANETEVVGSDDKFLAKYSADGSLSWARRLGTDTQEYTGQISFAPDGTLWVAGSFEGSTTLGAGESGETVLTSAGAADLYVARLDEDGALLCAARAGGADNEGASRVAAASDGFAIVAGYFRGTAVFGEEEPGETELTSVGNTDAFLAKYDEDCTLAWALAVSGPEYDDPSTLAVSADGAAVLTGTFASASVEVGDAASGHVELTSASGIGEFVARYDADGMLDWATEIEQEVNVFDHTYAAFLSDGSTYLGGDFSGSLTVGVGDPGEATLDTSFTAGGSTDRWLARVAP